MFLKQLYSVPLAFIAITYIVFCNGSAGNKSSFESLYIVDMPTAGIVQKDYYCFGLNLYDQGGMLFIFRAGIFENFNIGVSYGANGIIGSNDLIFQELPGILVSGRILDESKALPALTLGLNTQGRGIYSKSDKRFATQSPGIFLALSKNYSWALGMISFHSGMCYSFEPKPHERTPNLYAGIEQSLGDFVSINFEMNLNLDDRNKQYIEDAGLINLSLRCSATHDVTFELQFRDILKNQSDSNIKRYFHLEMIRRF